MRISKFCPYIRDAQVLPVLFLFKKINKNNKRCFAVKSVYNFEKKHTRNTIFNQQIQLTNIPLIFTFDYQLNQDATQGQFILT